MDIQKEAKHAAPAYAASLPFVYLRARDVASAAAISLPYLYKKIAAGELPQGELLSPGTRRWRSDVIAAWLKQLSASASSNREKFEAHIQKRACLSIDKKREKAAERAALAAGGAR